MEVYDTENSEWYKFPSLQRFRAASWIYNGNLYIYGGFDCASPNVPTDEITKIHLPTIFKDNEIILKKVFKKQQEDVNQKETPLSDNSNGTTPNLSPNTSFNDDAQQKQ